MSGIRLLLAAISVSLGFFIVVLDVTVANVSVPHISGALAISTNQGTWVITSYAVAEAICLPLTGWLAKRLGTLRVFLWGLAGFMVASILCGLSNSLGMLVFFRVAQGICGAPLLPISQTLLLRIFPKDKAGLAMSISAMTAIIAPISGPALGGLIADNLSWPWIFFLNVPIALVCMVCARQLLSPYETPKMMQRIDLVGLGLLVLWVGSLQLMMDLGPDRDWFASAPIVILGMAAAIGFVAFLIWELTDQSPIVELRTLRHRGFWAAALAVSLGYSAVMGSVVVVPLWAQTMLDYNATWAGYAMSFMSVFSFVVAPIAGRLVGRIDTRYMICFGLMWVGGVNVLRSYWPPGVDFWSLAFPQLLQGIGTAPMMVGVTVLALGSVLPSEVASAAGLMAFMRTLSSAAAVSALTTIWSDGTERVRAQLINIMGNAQQTIDSLIDAGSTPIQARATLERLTVVQSSTVSMNHVFALMGVVCMLAGQLAWLIPKPSINRNRAESAAAH